MISDQEFQTALDAAFSFEGYTVATFDVAALAAKGWTVRSAAKHLGVNNGHLSRVLSGERAGDSLRSRAAALPSREVESPKRLHAAERRLLDLLHLRGPLPISAIAQELGLACGTFSSIADRMEIEGLVIRERHQTDRRSVILKLALPSSQTQSPLI